MTLHTGTGPGWSLGIPTRRAGMQDDREQRGRRDSVIDATEGVSIV